METSTHNKFFMVWNTGQRGGPPHVKHATMKEALEEARRLAEKQPGDEFFVVQTRFKVIGKIIIEETRIK